MAHSVLCAYCKARFDRDKESFVQITLRKYAHAECALQVNPQAEVTNPLDYAVCVYCKSKISKKEEEWEEVKAGKFAHKACATLQIKEKDRALTDHQRLNQYVMQLFGVKEVPVKIKRQIEKFVKDSNYTYSGIYKALVYFYEIKGNSIEKSLGGIGIVPYVYDDAYKYYYNLWVISQQHQDLNVKEYVPKVVEVKIKPPVLRPKKRAFFRFLDSEEETIG